MLQKLRKLLNLNKDINNINNRLISIENRVSETVWANIYHDSIRGYVELEKLPLNIGRWAGSYSFFYLLNRVLKDFKPKNILELGLGESTKFISTYIENYLPDTKHIISEHDEEWISNFNEKFQLSKNSSIVQIDLDKKIIEDFEVTSYKDFDATFQENYDLILIDAPFGSPRYSRYDIVEYIKNKDFSDNFIIILDDTNRTGEKDTLNVLINLLKMKRDDIFHETYQGAKASTIITNMKFFTSV